VPSRPKNHLLPRRDVLSAGAVGWLGLSLPQLLAAREAAADSELPGFGRAKSCILLFMWGGPAHQDTWDLKPDAPREIRGEFNPISTNVPGIQIGEHFPLLARRTDQLAIIRSMTHSNVDHTPSTHYLLTGQAPPPTVGDLKRDWPSLGSVLSRLGRGREPLPPFVSMRPTVPGDVPRFVEQSHGQFAGWLGRQYDPLTIDGDPNDPAYRIDDYRLIEGVRIERLDTRRELLDQLEQQRSILERDMQAAVGTHYRRAFELLHGSLAHDAFDLTQEPDSVRDAYGRNPHGQSVLLSRRLIERGVPLVCAFWPNDGIKNVSVYWDTHSRNFVDLKTRLMPVADQAFSTLIDDLSERGLLDETLVIWTGEFGRTPKVGQRNSDAGAGADGRDHWPNCFTSVMAGGGIRGGQVFGASDRHAAYPSVNPVQPVNLMATVHHLLGIPRALELADSQGRPQVICPGEPILPLLS
jgi:hypothetical protein